MTMKHSHAVTACDNFKYMSSTLFLGFFRPTFDCMQIRLTFVIVGEKLSLYSDCRPILLRFV